MVARAKCIAYKKEKPFSLFLSEDHELGEAREECLIAMILEGSSR